MELVRKNPFQEFKAARIDKISLSILMVLGSALSGTVYALEAKDEYSKKHSIRVAEMAKKFSEVLKLKPSQIEEVYLAASVHDIGKIGIPDSVLLCQTRLDDEQWNIMKQHPSIGTSILKKSYDSIIQKFTSQAKYKFSVSSIINDIIIEISEGVEHHHEKYNGAGYPSGLKGENIPYISRIIALCDSTDAMLSTRCYRKALSEDICQNEISKNKNIMYDPCLTDIFLSNWQYIVSSTYNKKD